MLKRSAIAIALGALLVLSVFSFYPVYAALPSGTSVTAGPYPSGGEIHVVVLSDPNKKTINFPDPDGPVESLFSTVTTYVSGAVIYFESDGTAYSKSISPNSNTMMTFSEPLDISDVRITISGRGYSDDAVHAGYFYTDEEDTEESQDESESEYALPPGTDVDTGEPYPEEFYNVIFSSPGSQTKSFPSPEKGDAIAVWATVTTTVEGAVLHFEADGDDYSWPIEPNSNTLLTFEDEMEVDGVQISIEGRGYSDDQANVGYLYLEGEDNQDQDDEQNDETGDGVSTNFRIDRITPDKGLGATYAPGDNISLDVKVKNVGDTYIISECLVAEIRALDKNANEIISGRAYNDDLIGVGESHAFGIDSQIPANAGAGYYDVIAKVTLSNSEECGSAEGSATKTREESRAFRVVVTEDAPPTGEQEEDDKIHVLYLSNHVYDFVGEILHEEEFELDVTAEVTHDYSEYDLIVASDIGSELQLMLPYIKEFVKEGGGYVYVSGAAYWSKLSSNSDWLGASSVGYTGSGESAHISVNNPFGTSLKTRDILKQQGPSESGAQSVSGLDDDANVLAEYSSGSTYAYSYEYGDGRIYYQADTNPSDAGSGAEERIETLLSAALLWAAGDGGSPVSEEGAEDDEQDQQEEQQEQEDDQKEDGEAPEESHEEPQDEGEQVNLSEQEEQQPVEEPVKQSDLYMQDASWSPDNPMSGDEVTFSYKVGNRDIGAAGPHRVTLYIDNVATRAVDVNGITSSGSGSGSFASWKCDDKVHEIKVVVDSSNSIAESNENNNVWTDQFACMSVTIIEIPATELESTKEQLIKFERKSAKDRADIYYHLSESWTPPIISLLYNEIIDPAFVEITKGVIDAFLPDEASVALDYFDLIKERQNDFEDKRSGWWIFKGPSKEEQSYTNAMLDDYHCTSPSSLEAKIDGGKFDVNLKGLCVSEYDSKFKFKDPIHVVFGDMYNRAKQEAYHSGQNWGWADSFSAFVSGKWSDEEKAMQDLIDQKEQNLSKLENILEWVKSRDGNARTDEYKALIKITKAFLEGEIEYLKSLDG